MENTNESDFSERFEQGLLYQGAVFYEIFESLSADPLGHSNSHRSYLGAVL